MDEVVHRYRGVLEAGTVLVSAVLEQPQLLVGVLEEISDAAGATVAQRFGYAYIDQAGTVTPAGPAPYLDGVAAPDTPAVTAARALPWLAQAEQAAVSWMIAQQLPEHMAQIQPRRAAELTKTRTLVQQRLAHESERLLLDAAVAAEKEQRGEKVRQSSDSLHRKAVELDQRLRARLDLLDRQTQLVSKPPRIVTAALVLPLAMVDTDGEGGVPADAPIRLKETKEVERRGVDLVLAAERELGRVPVEQPFFNKGFDILSTDPATGDTYRIEVKARIAGSKDFYITHNEVLTGKNAQPHYRLALVYVDPDGPHLDQVRYLDDPFATTTLGDFDATGIRGHWTKTWSRGTAPH